MKTEEKDKLLITSSLLLAGMLSGETEQYHYPQNETRYERMADEAVKHAKALVVAVDKKA